jgi:hypothetical protein
MNHFIYDIETYPNCFSCAILHHETGDQWLFEVSGRKNQLPDFIRLLRWFQTFPCRMVGYNNEGFDYPVLHYILQHGEQLDVADIYRKAAAIVSTPWEYRFDHVIWPRDRYICQLDLFKIHHFDNVAKSTSLKMLEFQMRRDTIQELPYAPGSYLGDHEIENLLKYNCKDVADTHAFFVKSLSQIEFRDKLSVKYGIDMTNFNDTKIGKSYFAMRLEQVNPGCTKLQTPRNQIVLNDVIFSYIQFEREEFKNVLNHLKSEVITETKAVFKGLHAIVDGFRYDFGTGGIHGCCKAGNVTSTDTHVVKSIDVTSYYPSLAIANRVYPAHLGELFCDIYSDIKSERLTHKKGTPENAMLKLALNGVYGDSNNRYSPFYDPQYTMTITVNGQLLLCMLAEQLIKVPDLKLLMINTDGLECYVPREYIEHVNAVCAWWEQLTCLQLEHAEYNRLWIRDVNNYIGEFKGGKLKLKGVYVHKGRAWHQNQSALVVQKAVEEQIIKGIPVSDTVYGTIDPFDFCLRTNLKRNSRLMWGDKEQQRISRYYIARDTGMPLVKVMPPTPAQRKKLGDNAPDRRIGIDVGHNVQMCNDMTDFDWFNLDYQYYINKAKELIKPLERKIS